MASTSTMPSGCGDGTSLRQPRASIRDHVSPVSRMRAWARFSARNGPIGFTGMAKAGSSASTSTCVTTLTTARARPAVRSSFRSACWIM